MSSLTVNVNDQSYTGHQIRPTVKDSNNNTQITAKLGTVNIDLGQFTISYPDSKDANKEVGTGTLTLAPKASWSYVKKKYKLNTTNFLFLCNC